MKSREEITLFLDRLEADLPRRLVQLDAAAVVDYVCAIAEQLHGQIGDEDRTYVNDRLTTLCHLATNAVRGCYSC